MRWIPWKLRRERGKFDRFQVLPEHESAVRRLAADAHGEAYGAHLSLEDAKRTDSGAVVMEGDWGGSIYLTCPARLVHCDEAALQQLLRDLDDHYWNEPEGAGLYYELAPAGSRIAGGTGGGVVTSGVWLHPVLEAKELRPQVEQVIAGERARIL
jgi:hypothetical protein